MIIPQLIFALSIGAVFSAELEPSVAESENVEPISVSGVASKGNLLCGAINAANDSPGFEMRRVLSFSPGHDSDSEGDEALLRSIPSTEKEATVAAEPVAPSEPAVAVESAAAEVVAEPPLQSEAPADSALPSEDLDIPESFDDYWVEQGLPLKPTGVDVEESDGQSEIVALESFTVHDKTYSFGELRRMMAEKRYDQMDVTASYSAQIDALKISELVSMMVDVLDLESFNRFLQNTAAIMPNSVRFSIISVLNAHFDKAQSPEAIQALDQFLQALANYPVSPADYDNYVRSIESFAHFAESKVRDFIQWEVGKIRLVQNQARTARLLQANQLLTEGRFEEAFALFTQPPAIAISFDSLQSLLNCNTCSAARFEFVRQALNSGILDPNMKSSRNEHILFALASHPSNCNDVVKALLLDSGCNVPSRNKHDKSLRHVAKHNSALSEKDREKLIKLVKSDSRSLSALDKILPLA